jgi:hypothetical protein
MSIDSLKISVRERSPGNNHIWRLTDEVFYFDDEKYNIDSFNNDKWELEDGNKLYICIWARLAVFNDRIFTIYSVE